MDPWSPLYFLEIIVDKNSRNFMNEATLSSSLITTLLLLLLLFVVVAVVVVELFELLLFVDVLSMLSRSSVDNFITRVEDNRETLKLFAG